jgi:hypothetical protein
MVISAVSAPERDAGLRNLAPAADTGMDKHCSDLFRGAKIFSGSILPPVSPGAR